MREEIDSVPWSKRFFLKFSSRPRDDDDDDDEDDDELHLSFSSSSWPGEAY